MFFYGEPSERPDLPSVEIGGQTFDFNSELYLMGVLNVTPDSFSDGGAYFDVDSAVDRACQMVHAGADIIDVGGESTRPGAEPVPESDELSRVLPVIEQLDEQIDVPISIDTYKAEVAERAVRAGADLVNDISAMHFDDRMAATIAEAGVPVVAMHIQGTPADMQKDIEYNDLIEDIHRYFENLLDAGRRAGIGADKFILDPGIGFGKTASQNYKLLRELPAFFDLHCPLLVGPSRKSFIGEILDAPPRQRVWGTAAAVACSLYAGANLVRVHDVAQIRDVIDVTEAITGITNFDSP